MTSFKHPLIGQVAGKDAGSVTQFLGVKYGILKDRFSVAQLPEYDSSGLDATKFGPQVVSPPQGVDIELSFIQKSIPKSESPGISDIEGLHMNITVPSTAQSITGNESFPVLVFIHGGGFAMGGNWWPQYDGAAIVKLSQDIGKPIIAININYRLGVPGFLTSPELRAAGYKPNNGLRDQRLALSWIQKYIKGFGGDPGNVTVAGESAGGVSTGYLLAAKDPEVHRLICLGGAPPLLGQQPIQFADSVAQQIQKLLGLGEVKSSELAEGLLKIPTEDLLKLPPGQPLGAVIDGDIIPSEISLSVLAAHDPSVLAGSQKIKSIMLGDSKLDASILAYISIFRRKDGIAAAFRASIAKTLDKYPDALDPILSHYSLDEASAADSGDDVALRNVLQFMNDVFFSMPVVEIAAKFPQDSYVFAFNEPNPWDGPFKGEASHILDVAFLFQNFNEFLSPEQQQAARAFGTDVISYVCGEAPWQAFNKSHHGMAVYQNGKREVVEPPTPEGIGRHPFLLQFTAIDGNPSKDDLYRVASDFMGPR